MQIGHIGMVSIELVKEVVVGAGSPEEKVMPVKYQLLVPLATKWDDAEIAFDELREELKKMRSMAVEREEAAKKPVETVVEAEVQPEVQSVEVSVESESVEVAPGSAA